VATVAVFENTNGVIMEDLSWLDEVDVVFSILEVVLSCTGALVGIGVLVVGVADVRLLEVVVVGVGVDVGVSSVVDVDADVGIGVDVGVSSGVNVDVGVGSATELLELAGSLTRRIS
jgi:hypothetical protein